MKSMTLFLATVAVAALSACANPGAAPSASQVAEIQTACAVDAGIRPTVTALLALPGLAQPAEVAAVTAARAVIDPICANPSATLQADAISAVTGASSQILAVVTTLQGRKAETPAK